MGSQHPEQSDRYSGGAKYLTALSGGVTSAGGGGNIGNMEARVARIESDVEYIKRDIGEIKLDIKEVRTDIKESRNSSTHFSVATIIAVTLCAVSIIVTVLLSRPPSP